MGWGRAMLVGFVVMLGAATVPSAAFALDPGDSISLSAPTGKIYASYQFQFTGGGTVDGGTGDDGYSGYVVWAPSASSVFRSGCPQSYAAAAQAIDFAGGGPDTVASYEALLEPSILDGAGPYTYAAPVNDLTIPTLTAPGAYLACAYLMDGYLSETEAVSPAPVPFTVVNPPGSGAPPQGFGGPPGKGQRPSDLTLKVALGRPLRDPGENLLDVSGQFALTDGPAFLSVDIKPTSHYNGCASNDQQDQQITLAAGGAQVVDSEQVTANGDGQFKSPIALRLTRRVPGTYVVCAYLNQEFSDVAVGYDRITVAKRPAHKKKHTTHKKKKPQKH